MRTICLRLTGVHSSGVLCCSQGTSAASPDKGANCGRLVDKWKNYSCLPSTSRDHAGLNALLLQTQAAATSPEIAQLLGRPDDAAVLWHTLIKYKVEPKACAVLVRQQLHHLDPLQRSYVFQLRRRNPGNVLFYLFNALKGVHLTSRSSFEGVVDVVKWGQHKDAIQRLIDKMSVASGLTHAVKLLAEFYQGLVDEEIEDCGPQSSSSLGHLKLPLRGVDCLLTKAENDMRCFSATSSTIRDEDEQALRKQKILSVLNHAFELATLRHPRSVSPLMKSKIVGRYALLYASANEWHAALQIVCSTTFLSSKRKEAFRKFVEARNLWAAALQLTSDNVSGVSREFVLHSVLGAPSWVQAVAAVTHIAEKSLCAGEGKSLPLCRHFSQRPDAPWPVALELFQKLALPNVVSNGTKPVDKCNRASVRLADVLDVMSRSDSMMPLPCAYSWVAAVTPTDPRCSGDTLRTAVGLIEASPPRWDVAVALLSATGHADIALPIAEALFPKSEDWPVSLRQFSLALSTRSAALPSPLPADSASLNAVVLAHLLCNFTEANSTLRSPDLTASISTCSLRNQCLWSALAHPYNIFASARHGAFVFQSRAVTRQLLRTCLWDSKQRLFSSLVGNQSPGIKALRWHCGEQLTPGGENGGPLRHMIGETVSLVLRPLIGYPGTVPMLAQDRVARLTTGEAWALCKALLRSQSTRIRCPSDLQGLLVLSARMNQRNPGKQELFTMRMLMKWSAAGKFDQPIGDSVVWCCVLLRFMSNFEHTSAIVVDSTRHFLPSEIRTTCPLAAATVARGLALQGSWEDAVALLEPGSFYSPHFAAGERELWRNAWIDVVCCCPTEVGKAVVHGAFFATRTNVSDLVQSVVLQQRERRALIRIIELFRGLWQRDNSFVVRTLQRFSADEEGGLPPTPSRLEAKKSLITASMCLLDTRKELFPVAWAHGRRFAAGDVRPVALQRILRALPWERGLSIIANIHNAHGRVEEHWIVDVLQRYHVPDALIEKLWYFAAEHGYLKALSACSAEAALRYTDVRLGLRYSIHLQQLNGAVYPSLLRSLTEVNESKWTADDAVNARVLFNLACQQSFHELYHKVRARMPSLLLPSTDNTCNKERLLITVLFNHAARAAQFPLKAGSISNALSLSCKAKEWQAALYFFSLLKKPSDAERHVVLSSLREAEWKVALRVSTRHDKLLAERPDVAVFALASAMYGASRCSASPNDAWFDARPSLVEALGMGPRGIWRTGCEVVSEPFTELQSFRALLDARTQCDHNVQNDEATDDGELEIDDPTRDERLHNVGNGFVRGDFSKNRFGVAHDNFLVKPVRIVRTSKGSLIPSHEAQWRAACQLMTETIRRHKVRLGTSESNAALSLKSIITASEFQDVVVNSLVAASSWIGASMVLTHLRGVASEDDEKRLAEVIRKEKLIKGDDDDDY